MSYIVWVEKLPKNLQNMIVTGLLTPEKTFQLPVKITTKSIYKDKKIEVQECDKIIGHLNILRIGNNDEGYTWFGTLYGKTHEDNFYRFYIGEQQFYVLNDITIPTVYSGLRMQYVGGFLFL